MAVMGPRPVMTARRLGMLDLGFKIWRSLVLQMHFHRAQRLARDGMDESLADERFSNRREEGNSKAKVMHNLNQDTSRRVLAQPNYMHSFRPRFQMMKMNLHFLAIDDLLRGPRNGNPGADRGHDDAIAVSAALQVTDVTVVRQNLRPQLKIRGGLEDGILRGADDD